MLGLDSKALWVARCGRLVLQSLRSLAAGAPLPRLMSMDLDAEAEAVAQTAHVLKSSLLSDLYWKSTRALTFEDFLLARRCYSSDAAGASGQRRWQHHELHANSSWCCYWCCFRYYWCCFRCCNCCAHYWFASDIYLRFERGTSRRDTISFY